VAYRRRATACRTTLEYGLGLYGWLSSVEGQAARVGAQPLARRLSSACGRQRAAPRHRPWPASTQLLNPCPPPSAQLPAGARRQRAGALVHGRGWRCTHAAGAGHTTFSMHYIDSTIHMRFNTCTVRARGGSMRVVRSAPGCRGGSSPRVLGAMQTRGAVPGRACASLETGSPGTT
jgi:hypothetical protein